MIEIDLDLPFFSFFHKSRIDLLVLYLLVGWVGLLFTLWDVGGTLLQDLQDFV